MPGAGGSLTWHLLSVTNLGVGAGHNIVVVYRKDGSVLWGVLSCKQ